MHREVFEESESEVRYYCRKLPNLLRTANGAIVVDAEGREFIDLMSACGALNYGHNHPLLKSSAIDYLASDGILAGLDFHTEAKLRFIEAFRDKVLAPRGLGYRMQFPGPSGANCVEAALKLARKFTGRRDVVAFTNAFHGMSAGALSMTASRSARESLAPLLNGALRLPFDGYHGAGVEDLRRFERMVADPSGGIDPVAAFIVETVQGEGGLNVASDEWLRELSAISRRLGALLIVDDIQAGCGRTGTFFSFERAGIEPDLVCLAKSVSGSGLPMSLLLIGRDCDAWRPGEHNGTFRGNALAFVTAAAALDLWDEGFISTLRRNTATLARWCASMQEAYPGVVRAKGLGMMQGLEFSVPETASVAARSVARMGVICECCGPRDEVLKIMAPLNIDHVLFDQALRRLADAVADALAGKKGRLEARSSERDEAPLDPYYHCGDAIVGAELPHRIA